MSCGADTEANALIDSLTAEEDFEIPKIDLNGPAFQFPFDPDGPLYKPLPQLTNEDLTTRTVGGTGTFDAMMAGFATHLTQEYERGRITGDDYAKAYIALSESAMGNGVQFLLGRDRAFWEAQTAQIQAFTARVGLEASKVQLAAVQLEALNQRANFALTKLKLATESITYCTAQYSLEQMMPQQLLNLKVQETLLKEQMEAQRGQTSDARTDGIPISGVMGKQKDLYTQQITSYKRDSEIKGAKLFTDAWITMKSIDEGLLPPTGFTNDSIDTVLTAIKLNNELN